MTKPIDPKLAKFIADSKVKHRVYHGTTKDFNAFKPGRTWFATDPEYANIYAGPLTETHGENGRVMPLHVRATNPKIFNASSEGRGEWTKTAYSDSALKAKGHDSVLFVDDKGNVVNGYAMHPTQVKSAIGNRGTYNPNDPDITKANGGSVNPKYPSIQEMIQKLQEAGRTPIVPAPNRWFADPVKYPFQQKLIERTLGATSAGREGFPSGSYINPQTGEPMDFDIMHDLGVAIDPNTGRPMMSGIKSDLTEIDPKYGSITKSNLVRKGLFKHEGGDELLKNLAFLATIEKSGKGHHYGLSTHYASPAELVNTMTGQNPTLRPHSRGDIFGVGDEVGRISIQGKHHPVYEKLLVAPAGSDVQGKKLHKAKGGVAHMAVGGSNWKPHPENELLQPIGSSKMVGDEKLVSDDGAFKSGLSLFPSSRKSYRYVYHGEDQTPIGAMQIATQGPRSKKAVIQNLYVAEANRRQGIASKLLDRARQDFDVKHSDDLTTAGKAFAKAKKAHGGRVTHAHHLDIEERPL